MNHPNKAMIANGGSPRGAGSRITFALLPLTACGGCQRGSSSTTVLFGAYFPQWLLFAVTAVLFAALARVMLPSRVGADRVPFPLFLFPAIGVIAAWLIDLALGM